VCLRSKTPPCRAQCRLCRPSRPRPRKSLLRKWCDRPIFTADRGAVCEARNAPCREIDGERRRKHSIAREAAAENECGGRVDHADGRRRIERGHRRRECARAVVGPEQKIDVAAIGNFLCGDPLAIFEWIGRFLDVDEERARIRRQMIERRSLFEEHGVFRGIRDRRREVAARLIRRVRKRTHRTERGHMEPHDARVDVRRLRARESQSEIH